MLRRTLQSMLAVAALCAAACTGFAPQVPTQPRGNITGTTHVVQVEGRLENESLRESVGSSVTAYRIEADGRLSPLTNHFSTTDQDGRYMVAVEIPNGNPMDLLVRADSEFGYGLVVVPTNMQVEKSIPAQPITDATTVEAQVYLAAKTAGIWPEGQGVSRLHGLISETLAAGLLREDDYAAAVGVLSQATSAAAASWTMVLTDPRVGVSSKELNRVFAAVDWSLLTRDESLTHAPDLATRQEAESDFTTGAPLAYGLAKIEPMQLSVAAQATAESLLVYAKALHGPAQAQAQADAALLRAGYVTAMVNEALYQAGTVVQRQAVQGAGDVLQRKLMAASRDPAHTADRLHTAWADYNAQVTGVLKDAAAGVEHIDFAHAQASMSRAVQIAVDVLDGLQANAKPADTAQAASAALAHLYAETDTQASALTASDGKSLKHTQVRAILAAVGNLAIAAR